ncbi:MAG: YggS family pyridoxal phosphate-dependent enzyme [Spirochaetes bacterium]|nr:YggS family pyridoxal phosphate-dependent enzyme [Spirochaetota bacterium]
MSIAQNIAELEERIQNACLRAGRARETVTLMAVSKFHSLDMAEEARAAGIRFFGESRVKEGVEKFEAYKKQRPEVQVHMIGSLQRNKAKTAALFFDCVQSADRMELIAELEKQAAGRASPLPLLLELRTGEESKSGFDGFDALFRAAEAVLKAESLLPRGLMTMAPFTEDALSVRASFRQLAKAQAELEKRFPPAENWGCLSMGMTGDFEIAIEEGSTMLRIGSAIFGDRQER